LPPYTIEALLLCADLLDYPDETHTVKTRRLSTLAHNTTCTLSNQSQEEIEAKYLQLFSIGASRQRTVLYAGWWRDGEMRGPTYRRIETFYTESGYKLDPEIPLAADHLSVMLRFLSILIEEGQMESVQAFSRFLTWLNELAKSLESTSVLCSFALAVQTATHIINVIQKD